MNELSAPRGDRLRAAVLVSVAGLGFSAIITQLSLLRELLGAFSGNELVLGLCLGNWLLLVGAGTWIGHILSKGGRARKVFNWGQLAVALIPLAQVAAVRVLDGRVFLRGEVLGVFATWWASLALLLPYCLVSGALLTLACAIAERAGTVGAVGWVYMADCAGSVAGGGAFVFLLVPRFDHLSVLCVPAFLNLGLAGLVAWRARAWAVLPATGLAAIALVALVAFGDADLITTGFQHRGERIVYKANSPYGRLVVCERRGLLTFYENGVPVSATENTAKIEEAVHYALCQRPHSKRVLLVGGGVAGDIREILRYPDVNEVTCIELDPSLLEAGNRLVPRNLSGPRVHVEARDARRFIQGQRNRYDAVIVDLPDPSTSQVNRFYTLEFFRSVNAALAPGGVLGFAVGHYENFVGPELARLLSSARRTASGAFRNTVMIPGGRVFFLASDGPLDLDTAGRLEAEGIHPLYLTRPYLGAILTGDRLADLNRAVAFPAEVNRDLSPALYYYQLRQWLSEFGGVSGFAVGAAALALVVYLLCVGRVSRALFSAGFAASGIEVVLLLGFQMLYGSVYRQLGLVFTVFMAGLAAGAWWGGGRTRIQPLGALRILGVAIALLSAATPGILHMAAVLDLAMGSVLAGQGMLLLTAFVLATLVGAQFPLAGACRAEGAGPAGLFFADLAGAALGAALVSSILIPVVGVTAVCLLSAGLNAGAAAIGSAPRPCRP